jgi:hypothetical protein
MSKPIRIERVGTSAYHVFVQGAPVVKHAGKLDFDRSVAGIGEHALPILSPHKFTTKTQADSIAHQIGRYILKQGDFVFAYTEHVDKRGTKS